MFLQCPHPKTWRLLYKAENGGDGGREEGCFVQISSAFCKTCFFLFSVFYLFLFLDGVNTRHTFKKKKKLLTISFSISAVTF